MQKLHKIIVLMLGLIGFVGSNLFPDQGKKLIKNHALPAGQLWFESMKRKYPAAGLDQAILVESDGWIKYWNSSEHGLARIGCPHDKYYGLKPFEPEDEWCLLHEAGHVHNHQKFLWVSSRGYRLTTPLAAIPATLVMAGSGYEVIKTIPKMKKEHQAATLAFFAIMLYGFTQYFRKAMAKPLLGRIDEVLADNFACRHADAKAMIGGYHYFMQHASLQNSILKFWFVRWLYDFTHPASSDRAEKIRKAALQRFDVQIPVVATSVINAL